MMKRVVVQAFGDEDKLEIVEEPTPTPGAGEVLLRLTSIGMNHADMMMRRGEYKLASGVPPFTPGIEGGGFVEAVGDEVKGFLPGMRAILTADAPRAKGHSLDGTYCTHYVVPEEKLLEPPDILPDDALGTVWLPYLTAWGCLVWKQNLRRGQFVGIPACSSSVGLAAAQVARSAGAIPIGLTTSRKKAEELARIPEAMFEAIVVTREEDGTDAPWHTKVRTATGGHGIDVYFDPVASGEFLNTEIRTLAQRGTIWVYGLLGDIGSVDVTPLIRKWASIRGWVLGEIIADPAACSVAYETILNGIRDGIYKPLIGERFPLDDVKRAHTEMARGRHIGKLVLVP